MMQKRRLHAVPAMFWQGGGAAELRDAFVDPQACAAGYFAVATRDIPLVGRHRSQVGIDPFEQFPLERLVRRRAVESIRVQESRRDRVHPPVGICRARSQDHDRSIRWTLRKVFDCFGREGQPEHVFEADQLETACRQQTTDGRIGE